VVLILKHLKKNGIIRFMSHTVEIHNGGRITLPVSLRKKFNLSEGDRVTLMEKNGHIELITMQQGLDEAWRLMGSVPDTGNSLVDDLMQLRREESDRETLRHS
jgi:AbrB family looped-hinge helix DNA binding protein